jgi:putative ABC transport system permease protein
VIGSDFRRALGSLASAPLRALLTLLGVVMSTSSFVLLVALVRGGEARLAAAEQQANERDQVVVRSAAPPPGSERRTRRELSRADARVLAESRSLGGAQVAAEQRKEGLARVAGRTKRVSVVSATPNALALYRLELARGRFLDDRDLSEQRRTCVVGDEVWRELQGASNDLSVELEINGILWSVVGVLRDKSSLGSTDSTNVWNRKVLVPETSFDAAYNPKHASQQLLVRPTPAQGDASLDMLERITQSTLLRLHGGLQNFTLAPKQGREQAELIFRIVELLLVSTALVSLLVGGINVMNVMLVTVTERTREIGIRRAVGASPRAIRRQFLIEAVTLTSLGGLLGVALGAALAGLSALVLRRIVGQWSLHIEPWAILLGLGLSVGAGIVFGMYPARRASKLDVIEALRSE